MSNTLLDIYQLLHIEMHLQHGHDERAHKLQNSED